MTSKSSGKVGPGRPWFDGKNEDIVVSKLCDAWDIGSTDAEACSHAGISLRAMQRYMDYKPELRVERDARKEKMVLAARAVIANDLKKGIAETAKWYLERKKKDEFSSRQESFNVNLDAEDEESFNRLMEIPITDEKETKNTSLGKGKEALADYKDAKRKR